MNIRYIISGRVQGVGFRYFTFHQAQRLGVKGYVRNLPDGRVEVWALGSKKTLDDFGGAIAQGPSGAQVEQITAETQAADFKADEFSVRY